MFNGLQFLDVARFLVALIAIIGGGVMLFFLPDRIDPAAIIGVITLVLGYYFGATSEQSAMRRSDQKLAEMSAALRRLAALEGDHK